MADIRDRVVRDRGVIAQIQRLIPGFNGYRAKEDIRAADDMLRLQLADRLAAVRTDVERCRAALVDAGQLQDLDSVGPLINRLKAVEGTVRHAGQGYSGISAKVKVGEAELNKLYEYDLGLATGLAAMGEEAAKLKGVAPADVAGIKGGVARTGALLDGFEATFKKRMYVITGTEA